MWRLRRIDLKLRLALRVVALSALCLAAASLYALVDADRAGRDRAAQAADIVARALALQRAQSDWVKTASGWFPDLPGIVTPLMAPGLCIAYRTGGELRQGVCTGTQTGESEVPRLFESLYRSAFAVGREVVRPLRLPDGEEGEVVASVDPATAIGQAWHDASNLLAVMAATLLGLCLLVYAAIARALRPTRAIVAGLERLATGDLTTRLREFDLAELSRIRDVFNHLAESLDRTVAERNELTRKLIAVQDEERQFLARELHDEFGQCLAAIGAVAASAGHTARAECPALLPDCQSIARITAHMMETLRGALVRLRPPDIDELGLASSLESLIAGWNIRSHGTTRFELELSGSPGALPSGFAASLYRVAQEAITNAAKHAEATRVRLRLRRRGASQIELVVEDDGRAGDPEIAAKSGMGLLGMRERIAALGGRLSFEAGRPTGLVLRAVIPAPHIG